MKKEKLADWIANAVSHGVGVLLAIMALILLLIRAQTTIEYVGVTVFGISMITLYLSSTLYHALPSHKPRLNRVFKTFDHIAIYLLIAGTYTPFILILNPNQRGYTFLVMLWVIAFMGIVMKAIWLRRFKGIHLVLYLMMGWSILLIWPEVNQLINPTSRILLLGGGLAYTTGVIFYLMKFKLSHFIWHLFVLTGTILHGISIYHIL